VGGQFTAVFLGWDNKEAIWSNGVSIWGHGVYIEDADD
jgi:hypothetical protein